MNVYGKINQRAEEARHNHYQRLEELTRAHFARRPDLAASVDVERQCSRLWWRRGSTWDNNTASSVSRPTENISLALLHRASPRPLRRADVAEVLSEVLQDMRATAKPLREVHAARGVTMGWLDLGNGQRVWMELTLEAKGA